MRTPTYSGFNDAHHNNVPVMWEMDFWTEMLDHLARNRYNVISLWNMHPFPSIVKVPEYPDIALKDVYRESRDTIIKRNNDLVFIYNCLPENSKNIRLLYRSS